jgi:hypothetical protein
MNGTDQKKPEISTSTHHIQTFWQIFFPLLVALGGIFTAVFFLFWNGPQGSVDLRIWSDISVMLIILPLFLVLFIILVILLISTAVVSRVSDPLKNLFLKLNQISSLLLKVCHSISKVILDLMVKIESLTSIFSQNGDK